MNIKHAKAVFQVAPKKVELREYEMDPMGSHSVLVKSIMSGISHGTEIATYRATTPGHSKKWDPEKRLFVPLEKSRGGSDWPQGYENVGQVLEVGPQVQSFKSGDLIWCWAPHANFYVFEENQDYMIWPPATGVFAFRLPDNVSPEMGVFTAMGQVALAAIHDAMVKVGDHVVIFGAGVIGLLCAQLAFLNGAIKVFVSDPILRRRKMAESFGAIALDPTVDDVSLVIRDHLKGQDVDVAIESSGNQNAIHEAIRSAGFCGRVVTLGFYQGGAPDLRLGEEWHHNRTTMLSSMSVWSCPSRHYPQWNTKRSFETVLDLLTRGRLVVSDMISHKIPFTQAPEAYRLIDECSQDIIKVVLDYSNSEI